jgi:hypothetical protein
MWTVPRVLTWTLTLMICCASATPSFAQQIPKRVPKACKPWSEALVQEIQKSKSCEQESADKARKAANEARAESRAALAAQQARLNTTDGALQEARRKAREVQEAHAQSLFDFSERYSARGVELGRLKEREASRVSPLVWMGVGAGATIVAVIALRAVLGGSL